LARKKTFLYGKNSVLERLRTFPGTIRKIYIQNNFSASHIVKAAEAEGILCERVTERELLRIKRADRLQGIVAEVERYEYAPLERLLNVNTGSKTCLIFLDGINDPHNLGSILRISACFGGFAIVIPERSACEVNETVLHVASGGENYTPVSMVTNLSSALRSAKEAGFWAAGAVVEGGSDINSVSLPFPLCLVLGSEGKGIRYGIQKHLDLRITLPMRGAPLSLNVAMSCAIFAHEITRQRDT
jgi:23S rRNA (guanosine2251-2'-O)-methyltransferase